MAATRYAPGEASRNAHLLRPASATLSMSVRYMLVSSFADGWRGDGSRRCSGVVAASSARHVPRRPRITAAQRGRRYSALERDLRERPRGTRTRARHCSSYENSGSRAISDKPERIRPHVLTNGHVLTTWSAGGQVLSTTSRRLLERAVHVGQHVLVARVS